MKINVGILGGAGYTGGELIRLLLQHPNVNISFVHSRSNANQPIHTVHQDLLGETALKFTSEWHQHVDVLFLCLGHGESKKFLQENDIAASVKIIDLTNDFRLEKHALFNQREFVYGLPEINKSIIQQAQNIANPGCFATAIQLALIPFQINRALQEVFVTGITGSTGAGQSLSATSHFSWRANNIQAYKTLTHQHLHEIHQTLNQCNNTAQTKVQFVPWRGDFARGIFISATIKCAEPITEIKNWYQQFYQLHPFVTISDEPIALKQVINTNKCLIQLEQSENWLVIHCAIDNLLKGASGQAIQNMNLMFDLPETEGLKLKPSAF